MQQIQFLIWTQVWQIALIFVLIWFATRWIGTKRPHLALVLWGLFFVKCLVPPVLLAPIGIFAWQTPNIALLQTAPAPEHHETVTFAGDRSSGSQEAGTFQPFETITKEITSSHILLILWWVGSAGFLILSTLYFVRTRRQIAASQKSPPDWIGKIEDEVFSTTGLNLMDRQLIITENATLGPVVFGFFRPVILLPDSLLDSPTMTRMVLAHEACHLWRRDHWLGILQFSVQTLFWFHPVVWLASREANRLCEVCCDDDTLRLFNLPNHSYAQGLLDVLEHQRNLKSIHWFPGIRPVEITKDRIQRILSGDIRIRFRSRLFAIAFVLALFIFPAGGTSQWAIGLQNGSQWPPKTSNGPLADIPDGVPDDVHRQEMNFLIGQWTVQTETGDEVGQSEFLLERSGNMIREDWTSIDGATAQGITYFDPNRNCWVLTWVDGLGTIMESKGRWQGNLLKLNGIATKEDGTTYRVQTSMLRENEKRVRVEMFVEDNGQFKPVSKIYYCR